MTEIKISKDGTVVKSTLLSITYLLTFPFFYTVNVANRM